MSEKESPQEEFSFKNYFVPFTTLKAIHWIVIIGLIVFCNGLFNGFVIDDQAGIVDNIVIHSLNNFFLLFSGSTFSIGNQQLLIGAYYRPLLTVYFMLVYVLFGPNAFVYHLFQILLAITNACLLFIIFKKFLGKYTAFFLTLIFLIHPMNNEIAFYISHIQESLFFFFGIIAFLLVLNYNSQRSLFIASLFIFLSILSKETGVLFLIMLSVYVFLFKKKSFFLFLRNNIALFIIYIILRIHAIGFLPQVVPDAPIEKLNLLTRLINIPSIVFFYIKTFFYPIDLSESYMWVYTKIDFTHFILPLFFDIAFFVITIIPFSILHKRKLYNQFRLYMFFWIWFILGMLAHIQIIPLDGTVSDNWFYFSMFGLLGMLGMVLSIFVKRVRDKKILIALAIVVILLFSWRTFLRSFDFRNNYTLASHDIKVSSDSYALALDISYAYFQNGDYERSKQYAERSIALFPYFTNYQNLGYDDFVLKDYKEAESADLKSLQIGKTSTVYENLSTLYLFYGNPQKSISFIKNNALRAFPNDVTLWFNLALIEYKYGYKTDAKNDITHAYAIDQSPIIYKAYYIIMNNKPLNLNIGNEN